MFIIDSCGCHGFQILRWKWPLWGTFLILHQNYFWFMFSGKRSCVGEVVARKTMFLSVAYFFQKYSISLPKGYERPDTEPLLGFTNCPKVFHLVVTERQSKYS